MNISREIMWDLPSSFTTIMYLSLVISLVIFFYGIYEKIQFITNSRGLLALFGKEGLIPNKGKNLDWAALLKTVLAPGKFRKKISVAIFHSLLYYSFWMLLLATTVVAVHQDTPFKIFQGKTYVVISFLSDLAGVLIVVGVCLAFFRRYIQKPKYLSATNPRQELFMYSMILLLVILGFMLEGIRIYKTNMPIGELSWSPIGWYLALFLKGLAINDNSWKLIYQNFWLIHLISTMVFITSCAHSKFIHILLAPLNALITIKSGATLLETMDFENEDAESFGLGKLSELTMKNRLDLISCVECGRCTNNCPAYLAGKSLDPKKIITKLRDFAIAADDKDNFWQDSNRLFTNNELDACTTCAACMEECPMYIQHVPLIMELKRYKVLTLGEIPTAAGDTVNKIKNNGNPWGIAQEDRFKSLQELDIPIIEKEKEVEYLYYIGCAGHYDAANQKVVKDVVGLFNMAKVNFAVLGKAEKCNGDAVRRFGDEYSFFEIATQNIITLNQFKFKKIVTHCPHCLHTIKEYAKFKEAQNCKVPCLHHSELLLDLLQNNRLTPKKTINEEVTFHDPCYLGRHNDIYSAPREILAMIPGIKLKEMEKREESALCCGMGGGNMWYELPEGDHLAHHRLEHIAENGTDKLLTACSFCLINFNSVKAQNKKTENLEVTDIASLLAKSCSTI